MSDANLREILEAFAEKGWALYEVTCEEGFLWRENLGGPVDNLMPHVQYVVMPVTGTPCDTGAVVEAGSRMRASALGPAYKPEDGEMILVLGFRFSATRGEACFSEGIMSERMWTDCEYSQFPLDEAADRIRNFLEKKYERGQDARR